MNKTTEELKLTLTLLPDAYLVASGGMNPDDMSGPGDAWDASEILLSHEIQDDAKASAFPLVFSERAEQDLAELRTQVMVGEAAIRRIRSAMDVALGAGLLSGPVHELLGRALVVPVIRLDALTEELSAVDPSSVERPGSPG